MLPISLPWTQGLSTFVTIRIWAAVHARLNWVEKSAAQKMKCWKKTALKLSDVVFILLIKVKIPIILGHSNIFEPNKLLNQLSWGWKKLFNLEARFALLLGYSARFHLSLLIGIHFSKRKCVHLEKVPTLNRTFKIKYFSNQSRALSP